MKKFLMTVVVLALVAMMVGSASAQSKIALNIGGDVLLPMGTFGDVAKLGFGGSVKGEYSVLPELNLTLTAGYFIWSGKEIFPGSTAADFKGIPIQAGAKYYFMPASQPLRVYGAAELGVFIASVTTPEVKIGNVVYVPSGTASETDFAFSPIVGFEYGMGKGALDVSARYFMISTTGNSSGSLAFRVGYKFAI